MEDRYEILDVVVRGAMATVWRARDVRLGRVVAIKRPHAPDTGSTGAYLVMEFVDGPSLAVEGVGPSG